MNSAAFSSITTDLGQFSVAVALPARVECALFWRRFGDFWISKVAQHAQAKRPQWKIAFRQPRGVCLFQSIEDDF